MNNRIPNNQRRVSNRIEAFINSNNIQNVEVCFDDGAVIFSSSLPFSEASNIIQNQILSPLNLSLNEHLGDGVQESFGFWLNASDNHGDLD